MGSTKYNYNDELEFQMQIGSKLFPEYPIRSLAEAFDHLGKTLGIHTTNDQINMVQWYYKDHKFVIAIDTQNMSGVSFTTYSTRAKDLLTIKIDVR